MEQKTASARKFTWKEKMAALGPGFLIVGSSIQNHIVCFSHCAGRNTVAFLMGSL